MSVTTAEISTALSLSKGMMWTLAIETDRNALSRGGLGKGTKAGSLVGDNLIDLLRTTADLMDQEGITTLDELADLISKVKQ